MGMDDTRMRLATKLFSDYTTFVGASVGDPELIAAPGAGFRLVIDRIVFFPKTGATGTLVLKDGAAVQVYPTFDAAVHDGEDDVHIVLPENSALRAEWSYASGIEFYIVFSRVQTKYSFEG